MQASTSPPLRLLIHGGAGTINKAQLSPEKERELHAALQDALKVGFKVLAVRWKKFVGSDCGS